MSPERVSDGQADAALLAILRFLYERAGKYGIGGALEWDEDVRVLSEEGLQQIAERMKLSEGIRQKTGSAQEIDMQMGALGEYYRQREPIDRLWQEVEMYGLPALLREAKARTRETPRGGPQDMS